MRKLALTFFLLPLVLGAQPQQPAAPQSSKPTPAATVPSTPEAPPIVRQQTITLPGKTLQYTTTTGMMPIRNAAGELEANVFFMAYTLDTPHPQQRRLTFSFNGGPGSSSVWLHLGALGPKRVFMKEDGSFPPPPFQLIANEATLLDETDLVFIDPVGTGFSRPARPDLQAKFSTREGDVQSVGEFIRLYLTRNERWLSPLFLIGESYGTTRAAGLAGALIDQGIAFNGVMLVSTVLDFQTLLFTPGNDLPFPMLLPTFTATAWYHKRLAPAQQKQELKNLLSEVEAWATGAYMTALAQGDSLPAAARKEVATRLAKYTGLTEEFIEQANLRVELTAFNRELLRSRNLLVGRLDSRLTAFGPRDLSRQMEFDPSMAAIRPPYTAAFSHYVRAELGYNSDSTYYILGGGIGQWNPQANNQFVSVSNALRRAFTRNPHMKLFVGSGYYDMATPYFAARYTLNHLGLPSELGSHIRTREYPAGHMYYIHKPSLAEMKRDLSEFLQWAAPVVETTR